MNLVAMQVYNNTGGLPNTFIGGVSSSIYTPALLATTLGISSTRISNFSVIGSNIQCRITGTYIMQASCWNGNTSITYYRDNGGLCTQWDKSAFAYCTNCLDLFFPNLVTIRPTPTNWSLHGPGITLIYAPNCLNWGDTQAYETEMIRNNFTTPKKIYVHPSLATSNAGAEEGDIAYLRTLGATIIYVTSFTAPNPITTLSAGTIYNTAIQLNFTPPSSTNAIDYYECWVNGVQKNNITAPGQYTTGLTPSTSYDITLIAVDIFYNKSVVSNSLSISTTNRSAVDTDAVSYVSASSNTVYQDIIDDLYTSLKSNSLYTKIQAFYPFLGTTAAQHKWNGKNPLDTNGAFRLVFSGGGTFSDYGYQCNGLDAYANTFLVNSVVQTINNQGCTITVGTNNPSNNPAVELGCFQNPNGVFLATKRLTGGRKDVYYGAALSKETGIDEARCILTGTRTGSNITKMHKNGSLIGTGTGTGTMSTIPYDIGRLSASNSQYSNQRIQFTAIHEGLSDAEVATLHTIIDTFENALGRKTW
jgi:hypothetical protein